MLPPHPLPGRSIQPLVGLGREETVRAEKQCTRFVLRAQCSSNVLPNIRPMQRGRPKRRPPNSTQWLCAMAASYHRQRAHQQPRSGRQTQVRPSPQTGPATRHPTVSIGEKFLAAVRRPKVPPPVIASAVKAKAPASSKAEAVSRIATLRIFPSYGVRRPASPTRDQQARCVCEFSARSPPLHACSRAAVAAKG